MRLDRNFKIYVPTKDPAFVKTVLSLGGGFLKSEDDLDWYEVQEQYNSDTFKLQLDSNFKVVAIAKDISSIFPINGSVLEVATLPCQEKDVYNYFYNEDTEQLELVVKTYDEWVVDTNSRMKKLMTEAINSLNPYQYAKDLGIATEEDLVILDMYKKYIVEINRVTSQENYPSGVVWPTISKET